VHILHAGGLSPRDLCQHLELGERDHVASLFGQFKLLLSAYLGPMDLLVVDCTVRVMSMGLTAEATV